MLLFYLERGASKFQTSVVQNKNAIFFMLEKNQLFTFKLRICITHFSSAYKSGVEFT